MRRSQLQHDKSQAIAGNGRRNDDGEGQTGAATLGNIGEHAAMITSDSRAGKPITLNREEWKDVGIQSFSLRVLCFFAVKIDL